MASVVANFEQFMNFLPVLSILSISISHECLYSAIEYGSAPHLKRRHRPVPSASYWSIAAKARQYTTPMLAEIELKYYISRLCFDQCKLLWRS